MPGWVCEHLKVLADKGDDFLVGEKSQMVFERAPPHWTGAVFTNGLRYVKVPNPLAQYCFGSLKFYEAHEALHVSR
jgi:hypothetical protein